MRTRIFGEIIIIGWRKPNAPRMWPICASSSTLFRLANRLRQLFRAASCSGPLVHLRPDFARLDPCSTPQHREVIEKIRTLANDVAIPVADRLKRDLASFLDDLLRNFSAAGFQQLGCTWVVSLGHVTEGVI